MNGNSSKVLIVVGSLMVTFASLTSDCHAWCGYGLYNWAPEQPVFDGMTRAAWSRTWHGPNALATPLREYEVPRDPGHVCCDRYGGVSCAGTAPEAGNSYPVDAAAGFESVRFERLGHVANELDLGNVGSQPGNAGPPAAARR